MTQKSDAETGKHGQQYAWSEKEIRSLVEFVALYWDYADKSTHWPKYSTASNDDKFSNNEIRTANSSSDFLYTLDVVLSLPESSYLSTIAECLNQEQGMQIRVLISLQMPWS